MARAEPILIVDDNESNLRLVTAILGSEQWEIRCATDAEEALRMLEHWRPRLILMDIQLPGIDGLELTRRLKRDPRYQNLLVVALTAYAMKGDEEKAIAAGCDGYITKPVDTRTLPDILRRHLAAANPAKATPGRARRVRRRTKGAHR